MHVSNHEATFPPMHLVFLELDTYQHHLDFKGLDENNSEVISRTFYLQEPQEPQEYRLKKLAEIEVFFLNEIEDRRRQIKKEEMIKQSHSHHGHRFNYISIDCWGGGGGFPSQHLPAALAYPLALP